MSVNAAAHPELLVAIIGFGFVIVVDVEEGPVVILTPTLVRVVVPNEFVALMVAVERPESLGMGLQAA